MITFTGPDDSQLYTGMLKEESPVHTLDINQPYLLGVVSYPGVYKGGPAKSFWVYHGETKRFIGCLLASRFTITGPCDGSIEIVKEESESEQLALFD